MSPCDASMWTPHLQNHKKVEMSPAARVGALGPCIFLNWTLHLEFAEITK